MALQKTISLDNGLPDAVGAYIRIDTIAGSKENINLTVNAYADQKSFQNGKTFLLQRSYQFTPSVANGSTNFIQQGYSYLKTLPEFQGAVDA